MLTPSAALELRHKDANKTGATQVMSRNDLLVGDADREVDEGVANGCQPVGAVPPLSEFRVSACMQVVRLRR